MKVDPLRISMKFVQLNKDDEDAIVSGPNGTKDIIIDWKSILNFGDIMQT